MNTKFDVGQRVTYPVVHTADGNITGIAVSKAGVTRYAIGPKWYTESDLKLATEEKPVTEPFNENKPEPVKLYCVKPFDGSLSVGKVYEPDESGHITYDDGRKSSYPIFDWKFNPSALKYLYPLVRRPAKVGEWIIATSDDGHTAKVNVPYMVLRMGKLNPTWVCVGAAGSGLCIRDDQYLVLDGYDGRYEAQS